MTPLLLVLLICVSVFRFPSPFTPPSLVLILLRFASTSFSCEESVFTAGAVATSMYLTATGTYSHTETRMADSVRAHVPLKDCAIGCKLSPEVVLVKHACTDAFLTGASHNILQQLERHHSQMHTPRTKSRRCMKTLHCFRLQLLHSKSP